MWFIVVLSTMGMLHYSFPKQFFFLLLHVERSLQKFLKGKSDAYKVAQLHNAARALLSRCRCFRQQILTKISFVIFNIVVKTNPMWFSLICILINNDTGLFTVVKMCCETIHLFMHVDRSKIFTGI